MLNILSYIGMGLQSEVSLWTLLGLVRTVFDATLFKVNANLKQVWQMSMPVELSLSVQRVLRTIISGVMLVQCFTVYVYLASYIVLMYPVFLEERPTLVLPWLLLAAIRQLLCELTSLALGLGTCVLVGPARSPCIKFLIVKVASIAPSVYMWMLVFSYYHALKVSSAFKRFPAVLPVKDNDFGLELAIRRRRTKSLQDEGQLRKKLIANFYDEGNPNGCSGLSNEQLKGNQYPDMSSVDINSMQPVASTRIMSDHEAYEDWLGGEMAVPRNSDRIIEQFGLMMLKIGIYLQKTESEMIKMSSSFIPNIMANQQFTSGTLPTEDTETPPLVGSSKGNTASYLKDYPKIFMKKQPELTLNLKSDPGITTVVSSIDNINTNKDSNNKVRMKSDLSDNSNNMETDKLKHQQFLTSDRSPATQSLPKKSQDKSLSTNPNMQRQSRKISPIRKDVKRSRQQNEYRRNANDVRKGSENSEDIESVMQRLKDRVTENERRINIDRLLNRNQQETVNDNRNSNALNNSRKVKKNNNETNDNN